MKSKICGITNAEDALAIADLGADFLGLIFAQSSLRFITLRRAREISEALGGRVKLAGVFVNADEGFVRKALEGCGLSALQFHGSESAAFIEKFKGGGAEVWKTFWLNSEEDLVCAKKSPADRILADSSLSGRTGGTGTLADWALAARLAEEKSVILAGGISEENFIEASERVRPWMLDFNSRVEISPGRKDVGAIGRILKRLKNHEK